MTAQDAPLSAHEEARLRQAADALRTDTDQRWVEVSDRVLAATLAAPRRAQPVLARTADGPVHIAETVLVARLREALDGTVDGVAVARIHLRLHGRDEFELAIVEIIVRQGLEILPAADRIHDITATVLRDLLGLAAPGVDVRASHVHVSDVTPEDPQTGPSGGSS